MDIAYCNTDDMVTDYLTKSLQETSSIVSEMQSWALTETSIDEGVCWYC